MIRVGTGFDAHRFDAQRTLVLGGVTIEGSPGLAGHSDGDALSHAIADALLGAAELGDIGEMFPADDRWKDAPSMEILASVAKAVGDAGWSISNVDAIVIAERPHLSPFRAAMEARMAEALGLKTGRVSVKATTTDGMGFTGRKEGIAAQAVALLTRPARSAEAP